MSECHIAYWELMPTYDHVFPVDRGGQDIPVNIVTTSQLNNSRKSNFLIDEIGFNLFPPGNIDKWDGKIGWYKKMIKKDNSILSDKYCFEWNKALEIIEGEFFSPPAVSIANAPAQLFVGYHKSDVHLIAKYFDHSGRYI